MRAKGTAKGGGQIFDSLSSSSPLALRMTADQASGTLINQTSPTTASFLQFNSTETQLLKLIDSEAKTEMRDGALNKTAQWPKAICSPCPA